jgi:hypothetical protein
VIAVTSSHRLYDELPDFADELKSLLLLLKEYDLARQVTDLQITRRCSCEDDFCGSFYTMSEPAPLPWKDLRCVEVEPKEGLVILDVVSGQIVHVEVLFREDVRDRIRAIFP